MTDSFDGFAFGFTSADANSPGGRRHRQLLVVAESLDDAEEIVRRTMPTATFEESGPAILVKAREIGVADNDCRIYDPRA